MHLLLILLILALLILLFLLPSSPSYQTAIVPDDDSSIAAPLLTQQHNMPRPKVGSSCRADLDCNPSITSEQNWRCVASPGEVPTPANNCHLQGPYTVGNSTCHCSNETCSETIPPNVNNNNNNNNRTQYLMIGDSISLGMEEPLRKIISGRFWDLTHNTGNAYSANVGAHCLEAMLRPPIGGWDVISFNFGLHGLAHDTEWLTDEQYRILLRSVVSRLSGLQNDTGVRLVWISTTPVPTVPVYDENSCNETSTCLNPPRYDHDVVRRNMDAAEIITTENNRQGGATIEIVDLYNFVLSHCGGKGYSNCDGFQLPANVHFTSQGWDLMASFLAGALLIGAEYYPLYEESAAM